MIYVEKTAGPAANFDICGVFEISHVPDIDIYLYVDICHCYKCCWSIDICQCLSQGSIAVNLIIIYTDLFNYFLYNSKLTLALLRAHICAHYRVCATMRGAHICAFQWKTDDHILSGWFFFILLLFSGKSLWNI